MNWVYITKIPADVYPIPLELSILKPHNYPPIGKLLWEAVLMLLHRNTCSTNRRVYMAAAVIRAHTPT